PNDFSIIGKPIAMTDAAGKTTGAAKYTDDLSLPGMLVGKILHSPHPHARIKRIDTSRAKKLEGVVAVAIGKDAPNPYGILPVGHDEHALAVDKVRYVGDNVACIAAVDEATAEQALELIDVEYEVLPAYFDPEESMKAETDLIHDNKPHNIEKDYHHVFGDPEKGFAEADHVAEARFIANEVTDGRITAVKARVVQDGGAYCSYGVVTILYSGALLGALYDIPNIQYDGYRVLTNKPACGAMRGHGTVNVRFAFESQLDELAATLKIDPAEIRRRNLLQPPCVTINGLRVRSYGLPECIEKVVARSGWNVRMGKLPRGRGLGIACSHYVS